MIATAFQLFGVVSLAVLTLTCCSRYFIRVAVRLLTRQEQRLTAARCARPASMPINGRMRTRPKIDLLICFALAISLWLYIATAAIFA